jgi:hypothetical protein
MSSESEAAPTIAGKLSYGMYNTVKKTRAEAIQGLEGTKYSLADIPNDAIKSMLTGILSGEMAWIEAWQGNNYDHGNVVLYKNGTIGVVEDGNQKLSYAVQWSDE